jgi:adenylate cyclase
LGVTAEPACRSCGTQLLENAQFCHGCGSPVARTEAAHAEYKQVTVLFADVVHSMDIAATVGPERLREIMAELVNRSAEVVSRYGGTLDKFTGDGIMAVFGAPVALEDHAVRGCLAALGIQQQASELAAEVKRKDAIDFSMRVGLNSGEVIAGEVASRAMGYTAMGEHVGLAQRMESAAQPGGVMLSESTARLVEHAAILGDQERVRVKDFDAPVPARRLLGMETPHAVAGRGESALVGRRWEIAAVEANLERSMAGDGAVVALVGPAGIGKSRLMREVSVTAAGCGADVFWAFCESHTGDIPFHTAGQLLRAVLGLTGLDAAAARQELRTRFDGADEQDLVLVDDLLGIRDNDRPLATIDPDARRRRLSALVKAAAVARSSSAVYIVENVHWIDDVSDAMLADFMTVMPQTQSMFLFTHRPEFQGALTRVPGTQTLTLAPLSRSEAAALAAALLGSDPSVTELASTIAERAAGNPFFAEEIVRDLAERGVLVGQRGAYECRQEAGEISVPGTLQATIAARIDRLKPAAKRALCAAAVIGMRFDTDLLASMGVDTEVDELLKAELVAQVKFTGDAEYVFRQPLIRTVAYESQLKADRAALHRRLATAIEEQDAPADENAASIADHLEAAGDMRSAYGWRMRAAAWSQSRDIGSAVASWEKAARLADRLPAEDSDRLAMRIAPRTLYCANTFRLNIPISGERFEELQRLCAAADDKASIAVATMGLVGEHLMAGRLVEANRLAGELMVSIESIGDPLLTVALGIGPTAVKVLSGEMDEALRWCELIINSAGGDEAAEGYVIASPVAVAYAIRSTARWWLGHEGWRQDFDHALALVRDADLISKTAVICYTYYNAIGCGAVVADHVAVRDIDEALRGAEMAADDVALALALCTKANLLHQDAAQRPEGYALIRQLREMSVNGRYYAMMLPVFDLRLAEELMGRGDPGAIPMLRAGLDSMYDIELFSFCPWGTEVFVEGLLQDGTEGHLAEASAALDRLAAIPELHDSAYCDLVLLRSRALVARARGDHDGYQDFAVRYRDMATSLGFEPHIAMAEEMVGADGIEPPTAGV